MKILQTKYFYLYKLQYTIKKNLLIIPLLYYTLRHLLLKQIINRVVYRIPRKISTTVNNINLRFRTQNWIDPINKKCTVKNSGNFTFLNVTHQVKEKQDWNRLEWGKLWIYNLNYFDYLNAGDSEQNTEWHFALIEKWIWENPPVKGIGWDPYPTSLRIVNWIKWIIRNKIWNRNILHSLTIQSRHLRKKIEYHLMANHIFSNAKALIFAGVFFEGKEANEWYEKGFAILRKEIPEQILFDGGHFERSPMYQAIILEDLLDLINIVKTYGITVPNYWDNKVLKMLSFLKGMLHTDSKIALFNDSAFNISADFDDICCYAARLGFSYSIPDFQRLQVFKNSGYIRFQDYDIIALIDVAPIGPDYQPAHGHADTLTFEMSVFGNRMIVDSGTSDYEVGNVRQWQRSTAAHNTVVIDEKDSSEVWKAFRVARRAKPFNLKITKNSNETIISCSHDGYKHLRKSPVHTRKWIFKKNGLSIIDTVSGNLPAFASLYFHPKILIKLNGDVAKAQFRDGRDVKMIIRKGKAIALQADWYPEFGITIPTTKLHITLDNGRSIIEFKW